MAPEKRLFVFGASGHAKVVIDAACLAGYRVKAILDDDARRWGGSLNGVPVVGGRDKLPELMAQGLKRAVVGIGNNRLRKQVAQWLAEQQVEFASVVHPAAVLAHSVKIGAGSVVMAGAVVNVDTVLGEHVVLNTGASVDHDCTVGDFVHIAPGARLCGGVYVGESVLIGAGAVVVPVLQIGAGATVGAGAAVVCSVPENEVVVGVPARRLEKN